MGTKSTTELLGYNYQDCGKVEGKVESLAKIEIQD